MKKILVKILTVTIAVLILTAALPINMLAAAESVQEAQSGDQLDDPGYIEVSDGYVKIQVSEDNGGFYIGLVEGDKLTKADDNKNLLYPDSDYDTSFTTFRVKQDGVTRDYIFGGDYSHLGLETSGVAVYKSADNAITAEWSVGGLNFKQIIAYMDTNSAMHGMAYITYSVENKSGTAVEDIDARVMMDTTLGYQDYAIYMTANDNGSYNMISKEKTISGYDYNNFFYLYDSRTAPTVVAYTVNAQVAGEIVIPEKVTFAHWNNLAATEFDYEPAESDPLDFTSIYNADYMTADSAVALYYDMGSAEIDGSGRSIGLYYGVYSNHTVGDSDVGLNFINSDILELNEDKTDYLDANGNRNGNFSMDIRLQNVSDKEIPSLALAITPGEFMYPYGENGPIENSTLEDPYYIEIKELMPGEIRDIRLDFEIDISVVSDYRRVRLSLYNTANGVELTDNNLVLTKDSYVFCPGSTSAELGFTGMVPNMTGETGRRFVYITGSNFNLLRDKSQYRVVLRPMNGGDDIIIDSSRLVVNPELNTATVVLDEQLALGTWQVIIDWNDTQIPDIVSDSLRLDVLSPEELDKAAISAAICTYITIVRRGNGTSDEPYHYEITEGRPSDVDAKDVMLELSGDFNVISSPAKGIYKAEAVTLSSSDVINISGALDVKNGRVTVTVEYDDDGKQTAINVDIDGKVYTTGANTKVWDGVCAITSFEEGKLYSLVEYTEDGEKSEVKGDTITLLWPGAASGAQTLVGILLKMRYCEFGIMDAPQGYRRVVAFSAQLSPSFLIPNGSQYEAMRSPREEEEMRIAYANYYANDLRRVDNRYEESDKEWRQDQLGTLNIYVDDILFGGYFIGFNTSVEVGIPAIVDGMPYIEGTLSLKVINDEWAFSVEGSADFMAFEMEATLALKSYNGIPVLDTFKFFIGGFFPGVMVDPFGVFWIRGAGGGISDIYDTIFGRDTVPPLTLYLSGEFAIFAVLSARADLALSLRGFEASFTDIEIAGVTIVDYLGGSVYWYPDFSIACRIDIDIFGVIVGGGGITARKDYFEAYVYAGVQIPKSIWLIGGTKIGSAELGISTEKIWGKVKVIGIGVGITYYWGGDVDVDLLNAARASGRNIVAIGSDENGNTLYMETTNNVRELYSTTDKSSGAALLSNRSEGITSSADKRTHSFTLNTTAAEDGLITLTYSAANALEAQDLKDSITVTVGGEIYKLKWYDDGAAADDAVNEYTNALVRFDETMGEATVSISLTDPENQIGKEINVTTGVASNVTVYGIERFADLTSASLNENTVTVFGNDIARFSSINVYVRDTENNTFQVGTGDPLQTVVSSEGIESLDIQIAYPENLPTGSYTFEAVGVLKDADGNAVSNPIVEVEGEISYTNAMQPQQLKEATVALGGNYTIELNVTPDAADFDGYMVDIFEVTEDGYVATSFNNMQIPLKEGEIAEAGKTTTLTIGGRLLNTDENGEQFYTGLEEDKIYKVSVSTYKSSENGAIIESKAITTEEIAMVKPIKTEPKLSIEDSKMIAAGTSGMAIETTTNSTVTVKVADVGTLRSGYYVINESERRDWIGGDIELGELDDGMYTLTVGGVNETGDSFSAVYQFSVDTEAPSLLITSPQGGGFFDNDSVIVTGTAEAGATVTAAVGEISVSATVARDGSFTVTVPLDVTSAYQDVRLTAEDAAGNVSTQYGFTLTNMLLGDNSLELVILLDGEEVTHITAGSEQMQFELAFKAGSRYISINKNSVAAARINWKSTFINGNGKVTSSGSFSGDSGSVGIITATLDNYSATVEVIPTSVQTMDVSLSIPEGGYVYDGNAKEPDIVINGETELTLGVDYSVSYLDNVNAGTATVIITALDTGKCSGSKIISFDIAAASVDGAEILLSGEGKEISVKVMLGEVELMLDTDYTFSIETNDEANAGLVTVVGIGNYTGTKTRSYVLDQSFNDNVETGPEDNTDSNTETNTGSETDTEIGTEISTETGTETGTDTETESDTNTAQNVMKDGGGVHGVVWIIVVAAVVLVGAGVGAFFFLKGKKGGIKPLNPDGFDGNEPYDASQLNEIIEKSTETPDETEISEDTEVQEATESPDTQENTDSNASDGENDDESHEE